MKKIYFIDLFCGAGGVTSGIVRAFLDGRRVAKVIACVNHDINAIKSHETNHPEAEHHIEDIRILDISELINVVNEIRREDPEAIIALWASLECTNHSRAKGGMSRDADSRTLAEHLFRYIDGLDPDYIWIENVREFMDWGPLEPKSKLNSKTGELEFIHDRQGKTIWVPVKELKGIDFQKWVNNVKERGYDYQHKILDCANYNCYTHRVRYFGQFAKDGLPITWPKPTHAARQVTGLKPLLPVRDVLDMDDPGEDIFQRSRPLCEATLERIYKGVVKFVLNGERTFISKYYGTGDNNASVERPAGTLTTKDRMQMVTAFMDNQYGLGFPTSLDGPNGSLTTVPKQNLINVEQAPQFFIQDVQYDNEGRSVDRPAQTLIARMDKTPPYLLRVERDHVQHEILDTDSHWTRELKHIMNENGIRSIKRRMLTIPELLRIQGFGDSYILIGTQAEQKKYIGNSVPPPMVQALVEAMGAALHKHQDAPLTLF
jgi:DNA (cytosine-5)-methyltransferase 1